MRPSNWPGAFADRRQDDLGARARVGDIGVRGPARFADAHTIESDGAPRLQADKVIICTGGTARPLAVPGFELTATHSDVWALTSVPPSLLVLGGGATGVQVASIFNVFAHMSGSSRLPRDLDERG